MNTLREIISENVREGELYEKLDRNCVRCFACGHCCKIPDGQPGVCKVRYNRGGTLYVPWGYVGGIQCDPIEKKPFFHAYPGALAYSYGMLGCDLHCSYCQNWVTSQALRDPAAVVGPMRVTPAELVLDALRQGGRVLVSTYNEPLITSEWAVAVFREARAAGFVTGFVSNGNGTPQVLEYVRPLVDLYKVDLKSFDDRHYRQLGGRLRPILDTIRRLQEMGFWLEIVTLVIPTFNDSDDELTRLAEFLAGVSPDIPWHVTAFHKDYKMTDPENTSAETLMRTAEIGKRAGLRYIYAGNLPGQVGDWENTRCPKCKELLIERYGYLITGYFLTPQGCCPSCGASIPGRWDTAFRRQITDRPFVPRARESEVAGHGADHIMPGIASGAISRGAIHSPRVLKTITRSAAPNDTERTIGLSMDAGGQGSFQTAKARSGYRVHSLRMGHGRQRLSSEKLTNHSSASGK